jgi:hypothetical protein
MQHRPRLAVVVARGTGRLKALPPAVSPSAREGPAPLFVDRDHPHPGSPAKASSTPSE